MENSINTSPFHSFRKRTKIIRQNSWSSEALKLRSSQASRFPKNQESVLRSSFILRSSPNGPLDQQSSTNSRSSPDGPWRKCSSFFVHRSSKIKPRRPLDQPSTNSRSSPKGPWRTSTNSRSSPDGPWRKCSSFIVLSRSSPDGPWRKPHRSSSVHPRSSPNGPFGLTTSTNPHIQPFFKIKPKSPWRSVHHRYSRSNLNGPWRNTHPQDQAPTAPWRSAQIHLQRSSPRPLEETSNSSSKIKPRRPLDQRNIHKSTPYGDRIRGSSYKEIVTLQIQ